MTEPKPDTKKEEQHSSKQGGDPAKTVLPEGMMYPTPELNPETGAPIDPRFQSRRQSGGDGIKAVTQKRRTARAKARAEGRGRQKRRG